MFRRTLATVAATTIAVVGLAPAASAQANPVEQVINGIPCNVADPFLKTAFNINANTTRSDLAKQIRDEGKQVTATDPRTFLFSVSLAGQVADKAVECGTVKADPAPLIPGSADLGEIQDIAESLSSTLATQQ